MMTYLFPVKHSMHPVSRVGMTASEGVEAKGIVITKRLINADAACNG
jgi:hypothetical protein